ncbi:hypothetical protein A9Q84_14585 [Halobacteriovorax marinus]|uniref:Uncharacterized protein n=1 Tax=Halobacteriovorax marinus TaxID=97084 RepID=A0A1Y5F8X6_9BACT|nr:hypothetical protein A9Q84_14585 [Halobacteriovorax marinus]
MSEIFKFIDIDGGIARFVEEADGYYLIGGIPEQRKFLSQCREEALTLYGDFLSDYVMSYIGEEI